MGHAALQATLLATAPAHNTRGCGRSSVCDDCLPRSACDGCPSRQLLHCCSGCPQQPPAAVCCCSCSSCAARCRACASSCRASLYSSPSAPSEACAAAAAARPHATPVCAHNVRPAQLHSPVLPPTLILSTRNFSKEAISMIYRCRAAGAAAVSSMGGAEGAAACGADAAAAAEVRDCMLAPAATCAASIRRCCTVCWLLECCGAT